MKTKLFLTLILLGCFCLGFAQIGYVFILATRGSTGDNVYLSQIHKEKEFKKCKVAKNVSECLRYSMMSYLLGEGERAFNFDYYIFPNEGSYDTLDDAESKRAEAIKLTSTSGLKLQEVILKPLD